KLKLIILLIIGMLISAFALNASAAITKKGVVQLTTNTEIDSNPTWSPDGSKIAFSSKRAGNFDIWVMDSDGTNKVQLTANATDDLKPAWSPDGSKIAFSSKRAGNFDIWVMNNDGSNKVQLTTDAAWDSDPVWSPDGSKIAFSSKRAGKFDIWVMDSDGTNKVQLTTDTHFNWAPTWSPNGNKIAFESDRSGDFDIWIMAKDGTNKLQLTTNTKGDFKPVWSPDGNKIAFVSERSGNSEIWVMAKDGTNKVQLTDNIAWDSDPAWSPDGSKIAFVSERSGNADIWIMTLGKRGDIIFNTGSISITTNPSGAEVYLDEVYKGDTPITISDVSTGVYTIKLIKSGYSDNIKTIRVTSGKTTYVSETLTPETISDTIPPKLFVKTLPSSVSSDTITISGTASDPSGIESVTVNGEYAGTTFFVKKVSLSAGSNTITIVATDKAGNTQTVRKTITYIAPVLTPTTTQSNSTKYLIIGIIAIIGIIILYILYAKPIIPSTPELTPKHTADTLNLKSAFGYEGAKIIYKIKVENPTSEPVSDLKIHLFVPEVFLLKDTEKTISLLKPDESKTVTFELRPTKECGDCKVSGRVTYYDLVSRKTKEIDLKEKSLSIICPVLKMKAIDRANWLKDISVWKKAEETTTDIPISAEALFEIVSDILKDMNLFMLEPNITKTPQIFRANAKFYAEGVKGLKYAAQINITGGLKKSKLTLKAWAEKEEALTGLYHRILDEIEKEIDVKKYLDDSIVQYHINKTTIQDSVVIRSQIGAEKK
ncbi:MAG: PEGA domain-containing protein, partial [Methanosarcinales archaeon]